MYIKSKLILSFFCILSISTTIGIVSYVDLTKVTNEYSFLIEHDLQVLQNAQKLQKLVVDAETGQRGFIIVGDETFLEPYYSGIAEFKKLILVEKKLVSDNPPQVKRLEKIEQLFAEWNKQAAIPEIELARIAHETTSSKDLETLLSQDTGISEINARKEISKNPTIYDVSLLVKSETGKNILDQIRIEFRDFIVIENSLKDERFTDILETVSITKNILIGFTIIIVIVGILISFLLFYSIMQPISKLNNDSINISKGDMEHDLKYDKNDEFFNLINSFNFMKKSVKEKIDLEQKISKELRDIDIQKEEFTSMVTHELKTPLTPILGWLSVLDKGDLLGTLNEKQKTAVSKILSNSRRLNLLITDLLDAQKLDLGKMSYDMSAVDVNSMITGLVENFQPTADSKNIKIFDSTTETLKINSDQPRIEQVINNLVYNAIDFVKIDTGIIEIKAHASDTNLIISIKDNGKGISKENQEHLFKKFYQIDTSPTREHGGTGLGLSICHGICEGLGGKISVSSVINKETIFFISLPLE